MAVELPVVDFSAFVDEKSSIEVKLQTASAIRDAFENYGFVYLKELPLTDEMIREAFEWSQKFFALPVEVKLKAPHPVDGACNRGYAGIGLEKIPSAEEQDEAEIISALRARPDNRETFDIGKYHDVRPSLENIWLPNSIEEEYGLVGMRTFFESFYACCYELEKMILRAISLSFLGPDHEHYLSNFHSEADNQIRLAHYPPMLAQDLINRSTERFSAHSDFASLTILFQDGKSGLEMEYPNDRDRFFPAPPIPRTVLVNVGDMMKRWTNDILRSPVHRVGPPSGIDPDGSVPSRYSIPYFCGPDRGVLIDCLTSCIRADRPKRYEPITPEAYIDMRLKASF